MKKDDKKSIKTPETAGPEAPKKRYEIRPVDDATQDEKCMAYWDVIARAKYIQDHVNNAHEDPDKLIKPSILLLSGTNKRHRDIITQIFAPNNIVGDTESAELLRAFGRVIGITSGVMDEDETIAAKLEKAQCLTEEEEDRIKQKIKQSEYYKQNAETWKRYAANRAKKREQRKNESVTLTTMLSKIISTTPCYNFESWDEYKTKEKEIDKAATEIVKHFVKEKITISNTTAELSREYIEKSLHIVILAAQHQDADVLLGRNDIRDFLALIYGNKTAITDDKIDTIIKGLFYWSGKIFSFPAVKNPRPGKLKDYYNYPLCFFTETAKDFYKLRFNPYFILGNPDRLKDETRPKRLSTTTAEINKLFAADNRTTRLLQIIQHTTHKKETEMLIDIYDYQIKSADQIRKHKSENKIDLYKRFDKLQADGIITRYAKCENKRGDIIIEWTKN